MSKRRNSGSGGLSAASATALADQARGRCPTTSATCSSGTFTAPVQGAKQVGDTTYIDTWEGWLFLATVTDCATKEIIGYAMHDNFKRPLLSAAMERAANMVLPEGAVFHPDRGSNYTSQEFAGALASLDVLQSACRTGLCYDNARAKSFFSVLKDECVPRTQYLTRDHARRDIARYIKLRYNRRRVFQVSDTARRKGFTKRSWASGT